MRHVRFEAKGQGPFTTRCGLRRWVSSARFGSLEVSAGFIAAAAHLRVFAQWSRKETRGVACPSQSNLRTAVSTPAFLGHHRHLLPAAMLVDAVRARLCRHSMPREDLAREGKNAGSRITRMPPACLDVHGLARGQAGKAPIRSGDGFLNALTGFNHHRGIEEAVAMVVRGGPPQQGGGISGGFHEDLPRRVALTHAGEPLWPAQRGCGGVG
jgi:hypothetical protein